MIALKSLVSLQSWVLLSRMLRSVQYDCERMYRHCVCSRLRPVISRFRSDTIFTIFHPRIAFASRDGSASCESLTVSDLRSVPTCLRVRCRRHSKTLLHRAYNIFFDTIDCSGISPRAGRFSVRKEPTLGSILHHEVREHRVPAARVLFYYSGHGVARPEPELEVGKRRGVMRGLSVEDVPARGHVDASFEAPQGDRTRTVFVLRSTFAVEY